MLIFHDTSTKLSITNGIFHFFKICFMLKNIWKDPYAEYFLGVGIYFFVNKKRVTHFVYTISMLNDFRKVKNFVAWKKSDWS